MGGVSCIVTTYGSNDYGSIVSNSNTNPDPIRESFFMMGGYLGTPISVTTLHIPIRILKCLAATSSRSGEYRPIQEQSKGTKNENLLYDKEVSSFVSSPLRLFVFVFVSSPHSSTSPHAQNEERSPQRPGTPRGVRPRVQPPYAQLLQRPSRRGRQFPLSPSSPHRNALTPPPQKLYTHQPSETDAVSGSVYNYHTHNYFNDTIESVVTLPRPLCPEDR